LEYWGNVKQELLGSLSQKERDAYYDMGHPAIDMVRQLDLPLYEAILDALGIG